MKRLKLFEDYNQDVDKLTKELNDIKDKIIEDIHKWMKNNNFQKFYFVYCNDAEDFYSSNIDIDDFEEIYIDDTSIDDRGGSLRKVESIYFDGDSLSLEFYDGYTHLEWADVYEILNIFNYLKDVTPEMIEEQKMKTESDKFNL